MSAPVPVADLSVRCADGAGHARATREMFERIAPTYDLLNRLMSAGLDGVWRRRAVAALRGAPAGPSLDLCAGTLDLSVLLGRARPGERLIAADFAEAMLERGRAKVPEAEVVVADAEALPFADATIAAAVCGFGIRNVAHPERAAAELFRVMVPGGVFVTLELFRPTRAPSRLLHRLYSSLVLPAMGGALSGDRAAYGYLVRSVGGFWAREDYERVLEGAGFARVTGEDLTLGAASLVRAEKPS